MQATTDTVCGRECLDAPRRWGEYDDDELFFGIFRYYSLPSGEVIFFVFNFASHLPTSWDWQKNIRFLNHNSLHTFNNSYRLKVFLLDVLVSSIV